jgi:iron complex transport system substrate-binding protein
VTDPKSLDGVNRSIGEIGEIFDKQANADALQFELSGIERGIRETTSSLSSHPKVFVQISHEPLFTIGQDSFLTEIVTAAGGESVTIDIPGSYPHLSKETAVVMNPDVIILSESEDNKDPNGALRNSPAVKNGRVYKINADIISRPGPRLIEALEQIAKMLHPDKFPK